jgi:hypothetical protein
LITKSNGAVFPDRMVDSRRMRTEPG